MRHRIALWQTCVRPPPDGRTTKNTLTTQYNYTSMAARYNSENALLIRGNPEIAARYLENWTQVSRLGEPYRAP